METIQEFLARLRGYLAQASFPDDNSGYLDLAAVKNTALPEHLMSPGIPPDNLAGFQELIMTEIARCNLDKIKLGINEMLIHFLATIERDREFTLAEQCLYRLRMIFKRCLLPDFPFQEEIWNYLCSCLRNAGSFLLDREYYLASREIIDSLAGMGRIAALKGLPTANTQSSLRVLENKAREKNQKQLASTAKNARFNLET